MEDGFWRSLGLGLWISKDEAWWIDVIGGSLRLGVMIDSKRYSCTNWARRGGCWIQMRDNGDEGNPLKLFERGDTSKRSTTM